MGMKRKLTPEFWERDAASRRELAERIAQIEAMKPERAPPEQPPKP